ncbi:fucolectin-like [Gadus chalcogrammus]|uniref:fucolectin-like n=1 Tax=Gadus chalcogrammus TaxID=1042646 RepID=UPI0024C4560D|nr:fucolectin-like [Gadus chalcogrammus]
MKSGGGAGLPLKLPPPELPDCARASSLKIDANDGIRVKRNLTKLCCVVSLALKAASSIDVPLRGSAVQSSTFLSRSAEWAIDESCSPLGEHSCTHTYQTDNPWWRLQLDGVHKVSVIEITNRNEYRKRLDGVEIHIGNSLANNGNDNPRCAIIHDVPDGLTQTVHCWGMEGMYVNFYKPFNYTYLTLCEVKVYGGRNPFYQSMASLVWGWVYKCTCGLG